MRLKIKELGRSPILAGALHGRQVLRALLEQAGETPEPELCFLDFVGVQVATASFLRESVLAFRDLIRGKRSSLYPVIANATEATREDLEELLRMRGEALMTCRLDEDGAVSEQSLIGELDPKQKLTFELVSDQGETDVSAIMKLNPNEEQVGPTAWNNRLAALVTKGLIIEVSQGRAKRYRPLFEGV